MYARSLPQQHDQQAFQGTDPSSIRVEPTSITVMQVPIKNITVSLLLSEELHAAKSIYSLPKSLCCGNACFPSRQPLRRFILEEILTLLCMIKRNHDPRVMLPDPSRPMKWVPRLCVHASPVMAPCHLCSVRGPLSVLTASIFFPTLRGRNSLSSRWLLPRLISLPLISPHGGTPTPVALL